MSTSERRLHQHQQPRRWTRAADQPSLASADHSIFSGKRDQSRRPPTPGDAAATDEEDRLEDVLVMQAGVRDLVESWLPNDPEEEGNVGGGVDDPNNPEAALSRPKRLGLGFKAIPKQLTQAAQNEQLARQLLDNKGRKRPASAIAAETADNLSKKSGSGGDGSGSDSDDEETGSRFGARSKTGSSASEASSGKKGFQQFQQQLLGNLRCPPNKKRRPKMRKLAGGGLA